MKVIFVASGNKRVGAVSSFVQSQYDSLEKEELEMVLFPVVGKGAMGYLKAVLALRKFVKREKPDIIHAHYSVCGHVAWLACLGLRRKPKIVVSILGSFPTRSRKWKLVRYCVQHLWDATIVKSNRTAGQLGLPVNIIPNGVNLETFQLMDHAEARRKAGLEDNKKYVIWCSNPERPEKDYKLAEDAVHLLNDGMSRADALNEPFALNDVELVAVYNKTPDEVCTYMNAADCLLLTSWSEGSPNVIKEAMACNCPIVTTDVGDVTERLENLEGCYVATTEHPIINQQTQERYLDENAHEVAECLRKALAFGKRTDGKKRILADQLEITQIAKRIIKLYESI